MRILALEPYYAGSHRYFLDAWIKRSSHDWDVLTQPGHHWKWRMRHSAISFAREVRKRAGDGQRWDSVFCTDMVNLAEFKGLVPNDVSQLPSICYFHENQMTYPVRFPMERDHHFGMNNFIAAVAADTVWFNSDYHRSTFHQAMENWLRKMPEDRCLEDFAAVKRKSVTQSPGVQIGTARTGRQPGPLRVVWAARWEHDKSPEVFFSALRHLKESGRDFRLSVLGESFKDVPTVFADAACHFSGHIDDWGFAPDRESYLAVLRKADLFVSTAAHEFFGLSACEAMGQGAVPLLPHRLVYPELMQLDANPAHDRYFYDGSAEHLAQRLVAWSDQTEDSDTLVATGENARQCISRYAWDQRAAVMDVALDEGAR